MKNKIKFIEIYEKPRCSNCVQMRKVFDKWLEKNPDTKFGVLSAIDNKDYLAEQGVMSAPCYRIISTSGDEEFISGLNPDILMDALNGDDELWDF